MKKLLLLLAFASMNVTAAGLEFEQGVDISKDVICTPPTERTDATPLTVGELSFTTVKVTNADTGVTTAYSADVYCATTLDFGTMVPGQYEIVATITDDGNRESTDSTPPYYFLLKAQIFPPNAPTGITLQ